MICSGTVANAGRPNSRTDPNNNPLLISHDAALSRKLTSLCVRVDCTETTHLHSFALQYSPCCPCVPHVSRVATREPRNRHSQRAGGPYVLDTSEPPSTASKRTHLKSALRPQLDWLHYGCEWCTNDRHSTGPLTTRGRGTFACEPRSAFSRMQGGAHRPLAVRPTRRNLRVGVGVWRRAGVSLW